MRDSRLSTAVSIAEIISALAVIATLVYAVGELKRSQILVSSDIETVLYDRMLEMDRLTIEADGMAGILNRAYENPESLDPVELARYLAYEHIFYDAWEAAVEARKGNLISDESFTSWDAFFAADAARRKRPAWTGNLHNYDGEFTDYVESRVSW